MAGNSSHVLVTALSCPSSKNHPILSNALQLSVKITIAQRYHYSSNSQTPLLIHNPTDYSPKFPANSVIDESPSSPFYTFISKAISEPNVFFPLENILWKECNTRTHVKLENNRDELLNLVLNKARGGVQSNDGSLNVHLAVNFERNVTLSDNEIKTMKLEREKEERFKKLNKYVTTFCIPNGKTNKKALWDMMLRMISEAVSSTYITGLSHGYEKNLLRTLCNNALLGLMGMELPSKESCSICCDKILVKNIYEQPTCLPCCHMFHGNCIKQWLRKNLCCPLCQFEIKTSQVSLFC